ncbi:Thiol-disulfide oxidoreductase ResA [anaerobic digester metagenome]
MKNNDLKMIEKRLIITFIILGVVAVSGVVVLIRGTKEINNVSSDMGKTETNQTQELVDKTLWLPENCNLYEQVPEFTFTSENGDVHSIRDFQGKKLIVVFWASWCSDCHEEMPMIMKYQEIANEYDDVQMILIDKLDNDKETKEKAKQYLKENNITIETYYDDGLSAYNLLGMHNIPTNLFIDERGILKAWHPRQIVEESVFEAYLLNLLKGSGVATADFIINYMMDKDGGIHNNFSLDEKIMLNSDVLSESQGAFLEYAVLKDDKKLFDKIFTYINSFMKTPSLTSWVVSTKEGVSQTNALIDDLRIYQALSEANDKWGGYDQFLKAYETNLSKYGLSEKKYVDFYDAEAKEKSNRLTLCYADFMAMKSLKYVNAEFNDPYDNAVKLVKEGYISDGFPLYYSWYSYDQMKYGEDDLNMAEEMVILLHLAEAEMLPDKTISWLKNKMANGGIKARYTIEGKVVKGYNYDSTAVNALVAIIADEIGDTELRREALKRMELMRINDKSLSYNGGFGIEDGSGIVSFDQLMPILAYYYAEN